MNILPPVALWQRTQRNCNLEHWFLPGFESGIEFGSNNNNNTALNRILGWLCILPQILSNLGRIKVKSAYFRGQKKIFYQYLLES